MRNKVVSLIRLKIKANISVFKGGIEKPLCLYALFLPFSIKNLRFLDPESINNFFIFVVVYPDIPKSYLNISMIQEIRYPLDTDSLLS